MAKVPTSPPIQREMDALHPLFRQPVDLWLKDARAAFPQYELRVTETKRTLARQRYLYGLGRDYPNPDQGMRWVQVTWTLDSCHRLGIALDWVPIDRKTNAALWDAKVYKMITDKVPPARYGLELLTNEKGQVIEWPHIQLKGGQRAALQVGIKWDNLIRSKTALV